jgi:glycosyltransferase involved in cell wall biosynthesis
MSLKISVIVTAYNRMQFLDECLKSLENQTYKDFEIILVTNFEYNVQSNIKHIVMEGTIGEFLYEGIKNSKGDIISFLDDDDMFHPDKLGHINDIFLKNENLAYYHNGAQFIDENGNIIASENKGDDFNMSSITIKKECIKLETLKTLKIMQDTYMYICGKSSGKDIFLDTLKLTFYRVHESASNFNKSSPDFYNKFISINQSFIKQLETFLYIFKDKYCQKYIKNRIFLTTIGLYAINKKFHVKYMRNYILHGNSKRLYYVMGYLLLKIFGNSIRTRYKKKIRLASE